MTLTIDSKFDFTTVGTIPAGKFDVEVYIRADRDLDITLFDANHMHSSREPLAIVKWCDTTQMLEGGNCGLLGSLSDFEHAGTVALLSNIPMALLLPLFPPCSFSSSAPFLPNFASFFFSLLSLPPSFSATSHIYVRNIYTEYMKMGIDYSGYSPVSDKPGHEYIRIKGMTTTALEMKVFAFEAGSAEVTYSWGAGCGGAFEVLSFLLFPAFLLFVILSPA